MPLQTEFFALEGLTQLMKTIQRIKNNLNPKLDIEGVLVTMYDSRLNLSKQVVSEVKEYFGDKVYKRIKAENSSDNEDRIAQRIQGFFNWLASGVTHFNDIEQIGHSWDWVNTVFDQELLDMRLEQYIAELNGSASHIYRTEDW